MLRKGVEPEIKRYISSWLKYFIMIKGANHQTYITAPNIFASKTVSKYT